MSKDKTAVKPSKEETAQISVISRMEEMLKNVELKQGVSLNEEEVNTLVNLMTEETFLLLSEEEETLLNKVNFIKYADLSEVWEAKQEIQEEAKQASNAKYKGKYLVLGEIYRSHVYFKKPISFFDLHKIANKGNDRSYDVKTLAKDVNTSLKTIKRRLAGVSSGITTLKLFHETNDEISTVLKVGVNSESTPKEVRLFEEISKAVNDFKAVSIKPTIETREVSVPRSINDNKGKGHVYPECNLIGIKYGEELLKAYLIGKGINETEFCEIEQNETEPQN